MQAGMRCAPRGPHLAHLVREGGQQLRAQLGRLRLARGRRQRPRGLRRGRAALARDDQEEQSLGARNSGLEPCPGAPGAQAGLPSEQAAAAQPRRAARNTGRQGHGRQSSRAVPAAAVQLRLSAHGPAAPQPGRRRAARAGDRRTMPTTSAAAPPAAPSSSSSAAPSAPVGASSGGRQRRMYTPAAALTIGTAPCSIRRASSRTAARGAGESEAGSAACTSGWTASRRAPGEVVRSRGHMGRASVACELATVLYTAVHCCTETCGRTRPALCGARRARSLAQWVFDGHCGLPASPGPQGAPTATAAGLGLCRTGCSCVLKCLKHCAEGLMRSQRPQGRPDSGQAY